MSVVWCLTILLVAVPGMPVAVILAIVVASGVLGSVSGAISWDLLSEILPPGGYVLGRSVMQMTTGGMQIAGNAASAILLQFISPRALLLIAATLYAGSAVLSRLATLACRISRAPGLGRIRSAGPGTFARAIDGHLGTATTSTPVALCQGACRPGRVAGWHHAA